MKEFILGFASCGIFFCLMLALAMLCAQSVLFVEDQGVRADIIVLLGGGEGDRAFRTAELFNDQRAPLILVTGSGDCEKNVKRLHMLGIPASAIIVECASKTTEENARISMTILGAHAIKSGLLVTSWYHTRRARAAFANRAPSVRWSVVPATYGSGINPAPSIVDIGFIGMEYLKTVWYALRYGITP